MFTYPYAILCNYQNAFMHKSEPKTNSTFIIRSNKVYELKVGIVGPIGALAPLS